MPCHWGPHRKVRRLVRSRRGRELWARTFAVVSVGRNRPLLLATLLIGLVRLKHITSFLNYLQQIVSAYFGLGIVLGTEDTMAKKTWTSP